MISGGANHTELRYPEDTWQYISACRTCHILLFQYCQCSKLKFLILLSCSRTLIGKDEHGRVFIPAVTKKPETKPPLTNKSMASRHNLLCPKRIPEPFIINTQRIYLSKLFLYLEPTFSAEFQYFFHFRFNNVNIWINLPSCQCSPNLYFQSGFHCCALFIYFFLYLLLPAGHGYNNDSQTPQTHQPKSKCIIITFNQLPLNHCILR